MKPRKIALSVIFGFVMILICVALSLQLGSRRVPFAAVLDVLNGSNMESFDVKVIMGRIPRTVFGIIAGGALGVAGALMQSITRNPVADPSILGVNTGAALFVVCGISYLHITSSAQYIWLAIAGAALTFAFVYAVAAAGKAGATPLRLALTGAAVSIAFGSLISTIMLPDSRVMNSFRFWQVGSIGAATWENIALLLPFFVVGIVGAFILSPYLNALALGDEMAISLGVNVKVVRLLGAAVGIVLCGATTALAGPISFVGFMVPHLVRLAIGSDMRGLLPFSALGGAGLLLISDVIGRLIGYPGETEVGIVTALIGAPIFIIVARKAKVRSL